MGKGGEFEPVGVCPECGLDLDGVNVEVHVRHHWDREPHPYQDKEGYKRFHKLLALGNNSIQEEE